MPADDASTHLSEQQRARAEALMVARDVLTSKTLVSSGAVDSEPLITVARYVVTGEVPF